MEKVTQQRPIIFQFFGTIIALFSFYIREGGRDRGGERDRERVEANSLHQRVCSSCVCVVHTFDLLEYLFGLDELL